jgi:quercetin dioxygenase-like cupin family protein
MIVSRWKAPTVPTMEQIKMFFESEGLEGREEVAQPGNTFTEHRHPFDEVRMVVTGQMFFNVAGNQLMVHAGDRIEIPSNTRHEMRTEGNEPCVCVVANRPF